MKIHDIIPYINAYIRSSRKKRQYIKNGLIYFDKYDKQGDYHWDHYYKRKTPFYMELVDTIVELVPEGSIVLDIGCGDGLCAHRVFKKKQCIVRGLDINPLAIFYARRNNRGSSNQFTEVSIFDFQGKDHFDGVISAEVFEHTEQPELFISKIKNSVRENGFLIITTPIANKERGIAKYHHDEYSEEEFDNFLLSSDFEIKEKKYLHNKIDGSTIIVASCIKLAS